MQEVKNTPEEEYKNGKRQERIDDRRRGEDLQRSAKNRVQMVRQRPVEGLSNTRQQRQADTNQRADSLYEAEQYAGTDAACRQNARCNSGQ